MERHSKRFSTIELPGGAVGAVLEYAFSDGGQTLDVWITSSQVEEACRVWRVSRSEVGGPLANVIMETFLRQPELLGEAEAVWRENAKQKKKIKLHMNVVDE